MKNKFLIVIIIIVLFLAFSYLTANLFSQSIMGDRIAIIPIKGIISIEESGSIITSGGASSTKIVQFIEQANNDKSVKGIIFEINSPGGTVVASEEIANAIKNVNKPTTAWIREIGASGAYWIASSADIIVADPLSITGSIGVISSYLEFSELLEEYGINYERLVAGEYKDTGTPFRKLNEDERRLLQSKLDKIHDFFIKDVAKNRNLDENVVKELSNGIFYLGEEAFELGLIDYLGGRELALNLTKKSANITEANIVTYKEKRRLFDFFDRLGANSFYNIGRGIASELYFKRSYLEIVS